jgi:transcriptional regulator with XRE-family HTH domain
MSFKTNLQSLLSERQWTAARLSRESGVPKSTIADWMTSQKAVNLEQLRKVADVLKVPVWRLAYDLDSSDPYETKFTDEVLTELFSGRLQVTIHRVDRKPRQK